MIDHLNRAPPLPYYDRCYAATKVYSAPNTHNISAILHDFLHRQSCIAESITTLRITTVRHTSYEPANIAMLRRPPTVITLTSDDLAAFEVSRAQRLSEAALLRQQKTRAVNHRAEEQSRQRQDLEREFLGLQTARQVQESGEARQAAREDYRRAQRQPEDPGLQHRQSQGAAAAPVHLPPRLPSSSHTAQQPPQPGQRQTSSDAQGISRVPARQRARPESTQAQHNAIQRPPRRRLHMPTGSGSPHERPSPQPIARPELQPQDVDMHLSGEDTTPTASDDDETGELDDSMAGAGSGREAHARSLAREPRAPPVRRQIRGGGDDQGRPIQAGARRIAEGIETPTGPPAPRDPAEARVVRRLGRPDLQQPPLSRHERIMGRVEAPAPEGMGERRMR